VDTQPYEEEEKERTLCGWVNITVIKREVKEEGCEGVA
jgi:hypothetical protein